MGSMRPAHITILAAGLLAGLAALAVVAPTGAENTQIVGTVGPGFTIFLKHADGSAVQHLDAGTYTLVVHDLSEEHDFHLSGPGVEVTTEVEFVGDKTFTINVTNGHYNYICDPHASRMFGSFTGGDVVAGPPAPTPRALAVSVSAAGAVKSPLVAKAGRYVVTATDASPTNNVHLKGAGVDRKTGVAFKGKAKWAVTLKAGAYKVYSDAHRARFRTIRVS
jgi:plastocyanin